MLYTGQISNFVMQALAPLVIFISLALPAYGASNSSNSDLFLPFNIREYEAAMGIQRRAEEDLVDMRPKPHADLMYGRGRTDQQMLVAHMKLHASDGMDIVLMERFEHLTKSVDCHGQDGLLSLTFKSKAALDRALKAWSFVNEAEEIKFLLITNHEDCSPSDQRRPYIVTNVRDDLSTLTTFLTALEVPWGQIAGTYDLDFGKAVLPTKPVSRRILGRFERGIDTAVNIRAGEPGNKFNLLPGGRSKNDRVDCVDCYARGYLHIVGHFSAFNFIPQEVHLEVSLEDFNAALSLEVTVEKQRKVNPLSNEQTIADVPIPGAGIVIKEIISVGLRFQFAAGFTTKVKSAITFRAGLEAWLPWTSKLVLDAIHPEKSAATGFEGFGINPIFDLKAISYTADVSVAAKPKLVFGVDIERVAKFDISAIINLPELKGTCTAKWKSGGLCENDPEALSTGVELTGKLDLELDLQIDQTTNGEKGNDPAWQQKLWSADANLVKLCFPIDIPRLSHRKGKLVASTDLSGLGIFTDDDDDDEGDGSDEGSDSTEESDSSPTSSSEPDIFSPATNSDPDIFSPATNSDPAPTSIFTPERDLAASGSDKTTSETDVIASGTNESNPGTEEASSEYDASLLEPSSPTTTDSSSALGFLDSFQSPTDPALSPLPEFTTAPETSPAPDPALALLGSEPLPESTPPPDTSLPDTQLAMDTFLSPEPSIAPTQSDSSSASGGGSSLLPERNSASVGQLPPLGEGSNFDNTEFLPSETTMASASNDQTDQNLLSLNPDEPSVILDRSSPLPDDFNDFLVPPAGSEDPVPVSTDSNLAQGYGGIDEGGFEGFWT